MTNLLIDSFLLGLLVITAISIMAARSLLAASMLLAIYSLLIALVWVSLHAVDVAFTEAAVGAGVSTVLLVGALVFVGPWEKPSPRIHWPALCIVTVTGIVLIYGTLDMPSFGDPQAPAHHHVAPRFIHDSLAETKVPNMVTAVLASYRGFDTLFETVVIFTAGMSLILLLRSVKRAKTKNEETL